MVPSEVKAVLSRIDQQLASVGGLDPVVEQAIEELLNLVERLVSGQQALVQEVQRLKEQLEQKKRGKNTGKGSKPNSDHSSEKHRRDRDKPKRKSSQDRRTFKDLTIDETIECPVDPKKLPPDAVRVEDEEVIVQDIEIKPRNIRFLRSVHYSPKQNKHFRGALPHGYDQGDFGADLRALILSLKYCGNMSEPKIREFLENFDVQVSSGSISNILTKTADAFAGEFNAIVQAGLASTPYQQTDDTSARVDGQFWHTHILCNPFYAAYFTRSHKDRLTVLAGQFKLLTEKLALCWIHAGRHYEKLSPVASRHAQWLDAFLDRYWDYYQSLQRYRDGPTEELAKILRQEFDELFPTRTGYDDLDARIVKTAAKKDALLTVLSVPAVPLPNNASELQARVSARRRDVSLHSRSPRGARATDIFTTIVQTAKLNGISAYAYFRDRIRRQFEMPSLAQSIQNAAASS